jgi:PAT family beta-lactamase induction signal transducer AmpG
VITRGYLTEARWLRLTSFTAFYFAQGVPIGLFAIALPAWLAEHGAGIAEIAAYQGIVNLPWGFKLIAGPFMDRFAFLPMGRRRPWVMGAQLGLTLSIAGLAVIPTVTGHMSWLIAIGFVVNSFAAVQDVAVDGMAIDVLPASERARANALMAFGQVAGYSSFAALSGILLNAGGPSAAAAVAAATVGLVLALVTLTRERRGERLLPWTHGVAAVRDHLPDTTFKGIFAGLLKVLFLPMSLLLLLVELLVRIRDGIAVSVMPVFAVQALGISSVNYDKFQAYIGLPIALAGVAFGPLMDRFGVKRLYLIALIVNGAASLMLAGTPFLWPHTAFVATIAVVLGLCNQMLFIAFIALAMNMCSPRVAATQFAVYMSLSNLSRSAGAAAYSYVAVQLDYAGAFVLVGVLMAAAAIALGFFNLNAHQTRLSVIDTPREALGT